MSKERGGSEKLGRGGGGGGNGWGKKEGEREQEISEWTEKREGEKWGKRVQRLEESRKGGKRG